MMELALVTAGSAIGGALRYLIGLGALRALGPAFPWGTVAVNIVGSFLIVVVVQLHVKQVVSPELRLFLTTGVMGGFTTYSSFNNETLAFFERGAIGLGFINLAVTVLCCLGSGALGYVVTR